MRTAGSIADWGVRYIDDIVLHRQDNNADGDYTDTSSPADETFYHLTDAQFSTIAIVDDDQNIVERVTFSAYGRARHHWMADVDGDGDVDSTDTGIISTIAGGANNLIGQANYRAEADLDRDGDVDSADTTIATNFGVTAALAYGVLSDVGTASAPGVDNVIGFDGYVFNAEAELYTVRFRWYSPELGRWLQRDPSRYLDSFNLYQFVLSSPTQFIDRSGLSSESCTKAEEKKCRCYADKITATSGVPPEELDAMQDFLDGLGYVSIVEDLRSGNVLAGSNAIITVLSNDMLKKFDEALQAFGGARIWVHVQKECCECECSWIPAIVLAPQKKFPWFKHINTIWRETCEWEEQDLSIYWYKCTRRLSSIELNHVLHDRFHREEMSRSEVIADCIEQAIEKCEEPAPSSGLQPYTR